jgi:PAS domain S-box-containing protein
MDSKRERNGVDDATMTAEARLAADLAGMRRLYDLHSRIATETDLRTALEEIVGAANEFLDTDRGCIQLVSADGERLEMYAWRGYDETDRFVQHFLHEGSEAACDAARREHRRILIEDVETFPGLAGTVDREIALGEGIRATQHTPLFGRHGALLGVLSNQFRQPHRPSDEQLRLVDLLAWTAVDFIERHQADGVLRESEGRKSFLLKLADALRPLADPVEVQRVACRLLAERLDVDRAYYVEIDNAADVARVGWDFVRGEAPSLAGSHRIAEFAWSVAILSRGECHVIADTQTSELVPEADRPASAALQIISCVGAPLIKAGELVGALCVTDARKREWFEGEVETVREVGEQIWAAVERAHAEAALRQSEEKYRTLFETMRQGYAEIELLRDAQGRAVDQRYIEFNPAFERLIGIPVAQARGRMATEVLPELEPWWQEAFDRIAQRGEPERIEYTVASLDRWFEVYAYPRGGDRLIVLYQDVTERARAEAALRDSEQRFRQFGVASSDVLWIRDAERLQWEYLSEAFETTYGQIRQEALAGGTLRNWLDLILPEDREHALNCIRRVREGERVTFEYRIRRPSDGEIRWLRNTDFPLLDESGRVQRIGGIGHDATDEKEIADRLQLLVAELQHRTRNLIAVVRALADRTLRESSSLEDFKERYDDRLKAVSRVQGLLSRLGDGQRIAFDEMLRTELAAHGATDGMADRVTLEGPQGVRLRSATVQTFALALHELATNAAKYGSLSSHGGHLMVRWRVDDDGAGRRLHVDWHETGVDMVGAGAAPQGSGYGRELIERALPYQLKAETTYDMGPEGVHCTIAVPI